MARAIEITEENLEDLLAYDDLFNDYFNKFLSLPVFGTPLYYNRLTGTFVEVTSARNALDGVANPPSPPYGATDEERENQLEWARYCRLPLFLRTELFREFKLCKLLLRPLEDRLSATNRGGSSKIRGYSRQTEDYASSLSNSGDNSAQQDFEDGQGWEPTYRRSALYRYPRPGSRAFSLPSRVGLGPYPDLDSKRITIENSYMVPENSKADFKTKAGSSTNRTTTHTASRSATTRDNDAAQKEPRLTTREVTFEKQDAPGQKNGRSSAGSGRLSAAKRRSSKASRRQGTPKPKRGDSARQTPTDVDDGPVEIFDAVFGEEEPPQTAENMVAFGDDAISDTQTEADVRDLEGKHRIPIQTMKEHLLGSSHGMEQFRCFLENTAGLDLINFWLDCENFKDRMEDYDDLELIITRNRLYRDIHDKYRLTLTQEAQRQIQRAAHDQGLSHTVFIRTQYDILRRLRTYWVNRFLIHKERMDELSSELYRDPFLVEQSLMGKEKLNFFPSISLASSMPVNGEDLMQIAKTSNWESISRGGKQMDKRVKSAKPRGALPSRQRSLKEKLLLALTMDKAAGGPFQMWLKGRGDFPKGQFQLMFWQEVTEYGVAEDRSSDRLLRLVHAWNIYNLFISEDSHLNIGLSKDQCNRIHQRLLGSRDMIEASVFTDAKMHALTELEKPWIRYLKEDLKTFIDSCVGRDDSPPSTADNYEVILNDVDDQLQLYVKGPRPWIQRYPPSTASERGTRLRTALSIAESIDEAKRAERRKKMRERREMMEKERKKAVKAAMRRMREAKRKKRGSPAKVQRSGDDPDGDEEGKSQAQTQTEGKTYSTSDHPRRGETDTPEKPPTFVESVKKNKGLISMFKKYVAETDGKEVKDMLTLYMDIDTYQHTEKEKGKNTPKDKLANAIFKTYMEQGAKKYVALSDRVYNKLKTEKERPKSPTLKEAANHVASKLEESFSKYWAQQQEMFGDGRNMVSMSKAELAMRSEDLSMMTGWKGGKDRRGKQGGRPDGRAQPTRDDQVDFLLQLSQASAGKLPLQMLYFYKYLVKYSEDESTYNVGLQNDLFFYCEVQKFKDNSHQFADEEMMKRKVQSIHDCYLDSSTPPSLQINTPSDIAQKAIRGANKYLQGKEVNTTLFDEAQYSVFKNLLPYWAGFVKSYKQPTDDKKTPLTKPQRDRRKRLDEVMQWRTPSARTVHLPSLPKGASVAAFTFSLNEGIKWREMGGDGMHEFDGSMAGSVMATRRNTSMSVRPTKRSNTMDTEISKRSIAAK